MINLQTLDKLTTTAFQDASLLWTLSGVGNPARGDTYEAVELTLQHGGRLLLLYDNDTPVGTCWLTHDYRRLYIHHMAVHPDYQNQGYGRMLMQAALDYARTLGLQAKLEVKEQNAPAYHLYSAFGFEPISGYTVMIKRKMD